MLAIEICKDKYTVYKVASLVSTPTNGYFERENDAFVFKKCAAARNTTLTKSAIAQECAPYRDQVVVNVTNEIVF